MRRTLSSVSLWTKEETAQSSRSSEAEKVSGLNAAPPAGHAFLARSSTGLSRMVLVGFHPGRVGPHQPTI